MAELTTGISDIKEDLVHMSDGLELRCIGGRLEAEIAGLWDRFAQLFCC